MIDEDTYCIDVLTQITSVTISLRRVGPGLLDEHLRTCVVTPLQPKQIAATRRSPMRSAPSNVCCANSPNRLAESVQIARSQRETESSMRRPANSAPLVRHRVEQMNHPATEFHRPARFPQRTRAGVGMQHFDKKEDVMSAKDPVCGMVIEEADAVGTSEHHDKMYYFCSNDCKEEFDTNPEDYAG